MIWEALTKLSLLGTERGQLPGEAQQALLRLGLEADAPPEQTVLEGLALYHQLRRAGYQPAPHEGSSDTPPPSGRRAVNAQAARILQHIVQGRYRDALPEYLRLIEAGGWQLPPEQLPALFYYAAKRPAFWDQLRPLLSARDHWLLRQNKDWQPLAERPPEDDWQECSPEERAMMLRYLRRHAPETAAGYLSPIWEDLPYTEKKSLLEQLAIGLGEADEPFLEQARQDSRKEVRQAAVRLLTLLPGARLQEELYAGAARLLRLDDQGNLRIAYPDAPGKADKRLGIGRGGAGKYAGGQKAGWAYDWLSRIPPGRWETHFKKNTLDTMRLFLRGDKHQLLADAVTNAALLHRDHRWMEALLRHWWRTDNEARWNTALGKQLMSELPEATFNQLLENHLRQHTNYLEENSLPTQWLCLGQHPWSPALSKAVVQGLQQWLAGGQSYHWNLWHYKRVLKVGAYQVHPALLSEFRHGWDKRAPAWERWAPDVDRFLKVLSFRRDMRRALQPEQ